MKLFKNCNILYFKKSEIFTDLILQNDNIFKGKIIISDSHELNRLCSVNGIIHVVNLNTNYIPNEKIDCIIDNEKNSDLEISIIKNRTSIPIMYFNNSKKIQQIWCGCCNKNYTNDNNHTISKYCSEKCMKKENGFVTDSNGNIKSEIVKDLGINDILSKIIASEKEKEEPLVLEFDKSVSDKRTISNAKKTIDKFQSSVVKDAIRLEYAFKRESYKREMRQPSLRKASLSNKKEKVTVIEDVETTKLCKGITKKGTQCINRAIGSSNFCGILSHAMSADK